jgi:hypothetical protein
MNVTQENGILKVGSWVSYQDMANPQRFGIVYRTEKADIRQFVIGAGGLKPAGGRLFVIYENGTQTETTETAIDGPGGWSHHPEKGIAPPEDIAALKEKGEQRQRKMDAEREAAAERDKAERESGRALLEEKRPASMAGSSQRRRPLTSLTSQRRRHRSSSDATYRLPA